MYIINAFLDGTPSNIYEYTLAVVAGCYTKRNEIQDEI